MKVATIMYENGHSLRESDIYEVIIADESIDIQEEFYKARDKVCERQGSDCDWFLDEVYAEFDFDFEVLDFRTAKV